MIERESAETFERVVQVAVESGAVVVIAMEDTVAVVREIADEIEAKVAINTTELVAGVLVKPMLTR